MCWSNHYSKIKRHLEQKHFWGSLGVLQDARYSMLCVRKNLLEKVQTINHQGGYRLSSVGKSDSKMTSSTSWTHLGMKKQFFRYHFTLTWSVDRFLFGGKLVWTWCKWVLTQLHYLTLVQACNQEILTHEQSIKINIE